MAASSAASRHEVLPRRARRRHPGAESAGRAVPAGAVLPDRRHRRGATRRPGWICPTSSPSAARGWRRGRASRRGDWAAITARAARWSARADLLPTGDDHVMQTASPRSPTGSSRAAMTAARAISTGSTRPPTAPAARGRGSAAPTRRTASPPAAPDDKAQLRGGHAPNLAIVTAYNDMLSAHQPYERYPELIRDAAREAGGTAQVAGGVPAMCDGVTQGEAGMELSLFSRDVIAHGDRRRAVAPDLRRRRLSRRLRQDRAGPGHRRARLRPSAGGVHPGRADDRPACPTTRRPRIRQLYRRGQGRPRRAARSRDRSPTTGPAPAPSTAPPTPTRC